MYLAFVVTCKYMKKNTRTSKPKTKQVKPKAKPKATPKKVAKKAVPKKSNKKPDNKPEIKRTGKGSHPNSLANLKPPFDGSTPGPGRPKGKLNFDTRVDLAIEALAIKMALAHNAKKENKNNQITQEDLDIEGDIFMQLINKARAGNEKMIDSFLDRRHGKATARVELTGKDGDPIAYEERKKEAKSKARRMLDMWTKDA